MNQAIGFDISLARRLSDGSAAQADLHEQGIEPGSLYLMSGTETRAVRVLSMTIAGDKGTASLRMPAVIDHMMVSSPDICASIALSVHVVTGAMMIDALCLEPETNGIYVADSLILPAGAESKSCELLIESAVNFLELRFYQYADHADPNETTFALVDGVSVRTFRVPALEPQAILPEYQETLFAVYDLGRDPVSFDLYVALCYFEMLRVDLDLKRIFVVLLQKRSREGDDLRNPPEYRQAISSDSVDWRVYNLAVSFLQFFPTISGHCLATSKYQLMQLMRSVPNRYPARTALHQNQERLLRAWRNVYGRFGTVSGYCYPRAPQMAREFVRRWLAENDRGKRVLTISLRQSDYDVPRNSELAEWGRFCISVQDEFTPVIVVDTDKIFVPLPKEFDAFPRFNEAALNVAIRMALYEEAYLNFFNPSGPLVLAKFSMNIRYLYFKPIANVRSASYEVNRELGAPIHRSPNHAPPFQKWVWKDDKFDTIVEEFEQMRKILDASH